MKKGVVILIFLMIALSGCRQNEKNLHEQKEQLDVQKETLPVGQQDVEDSQPVLSLDSYATFIGMSKQEVLAQLGDHYDLRPMGISNLDQGYYFDDIKTAFFFNGDQRLQYIEHQGEAEFIHKEKCSDFSSIKEVYGEAEVDSYEIVDDGYADDGMVREYFCGSDNYYEISYIESEYLVSFVSKEETGKDYTIYIYRPVGFLNPNEIKELLDYNSSQIQNRFGMDCILSRQTDELFTYWNYYRAIGLYFGQNCDGVEENRFIQFAPWIEFSLVHAGLNFEEVKQELGDSLIMKENRYMMGCVVYTMEFREEDFFLSFESNDILGNDSKMQIAKTKKGYRDQIREDFRWNFYEDKVGFEYKGEEYILNLDDPEEILPLYDSSAYERFQIPEDALGAGIYYGGWEGRIESFYVAFDSDEDMNLYVRRYGDTSDKNYPSETYSIEQILLENQAESYSKYEIEHNEVRDEILLGNVTEEQKKIISDINDTIQKHQLYLCFSLDSYNYHDMLWPKVLKKEIVYDFNLDGKLEVLRISYKFGTQEKSAESVSKDTVIEIALGNKKVMFKLEEYETLEIGICDVDLADGFIDIYTTEYADCYGSSLLFRLNGESLEEALDLGYDEIVGVSGDGKIYVWNGCYRTPYLEETYEDLTLWYIDYKTGMSVSSNHMIEKPYRATYGDILFRDFEYVPKGEPTEVTMVLEGAIYEPEEGELLTVIDKDDSSQTIKVRTQDGQEGWIGGHHMVWN